LIATSILFGIAANNADRALLNIFSKSLKKADKVVHHKLKKALKRSFLSALQNIVLECHKELYPHKFLGVWPIYPPGHRDDLKWLDQKRNQLARELKQLKREKFVNTLFASLDEIKSLLNTTDLLTNENIQLVKEKLIAEALKNGVVPECYERKVRADLFEPVRDHFIWEINHNSVVNSFFHAQLLAKINAQLTEQNSAIQKLAKTLQASREATVTVKLDVDINEFSTPQLLAIIENLRQRGKDVTLRIRRLEAGCVALVLEGSQKGIKRIEELFKSGQLTEISGIPVKDVRVVSALPPSRTLVKLSQWLQNNFVEAIEAGWQTLDMIFGTAIPAFRTKTAVKRAKQIKLGADQTVALVIELNDLGNQKIRVILRVYPTDDHTYLPENLKLTLLSESGEPLEEIQAGNNKDCIEQPLTGVPGERFSVNLALGDVSVTEDFVI